MRKVRRKDARPRSLKRQRDVLCDVMLSAGSCETWLTLGELSGMTRYGEASISAQLRHLRKPCYGGFALEKRRREVAEVICKVAHGPVWEYRLTRATRKFPPAAALPAPSPSGASPAGAPTATGY